MRNDRLGKYLSFILRHDPEHIGMKMDEEGWLNVEDMIKNINNVEKFKLSRENVEKEVKEDEKGRFEISKDGLFIRCLQGHSKGLTNVEFEEIIDENKIPNFLIHGTKGSLEKLLTEEGLKKGKRDYVHLIEDVQIAIENGERWKEKNVLVIYIDAHKMKKDGFKFLKSKNNVWLVESVPSKYFIRKEVVKNSKSEKLRKKFDF